MDCEERLLEQAQMTKKVNPDAHVFVYRNVVKALPWFTKVGENICKAILFYGSSPRLVFLHHKLRILSAVVCTRSARNWMIRNILGGFCDFGMMAKLVLITCQFARQRTHRSAQSSTTTKSKHQRFRLQRNPTLTGAAQMDNATVARIHVANVSAET